MSFKDFTALNALTPKSNAGSQLRFLNRILDLTNSIFTAVQSVAGNYTTMYNSVRQTYINSGSYVDITPDQQAKIADNLLVRQAESIKNSRDYINRLSSEEDFSRMFTISESQPLAYENHTATYDIITALYIGRTDASRKGSILVKDYIQQLLTRVAVKERNLGSATFAINLMHELYKDRVDDSFYLTLVDVRHDNGVTGFTFASYSDDLLNQNNGQTNSKAGVVTIFITDAEQQSCTVKDYDLVWDAPDQKLVLYTNVFSGTLDSDYNVVLSHSQQSSQKFNAAAVTPAQWLTANLSPLPGTIQFPGRAVGSGTSVSSNYTSRTSIDDLLNDQEWYDNVIAAIKP